MPLRLVIDLVPSSCWSNNVRSALTKAQWDYIKSDVASKAYNVCEICGDVGPKHPVECHEIWSYDNKKLIQKLDGLQALCPNCHMVKHIGLARVQGRGVAALRHFMKINQLSVKDAERIIDQAFDVWAQRSKKTWKLDISYLKVYGINVEKIKKD